MAGAVLKHLSIDVLSPREVTRLMKAQALIQLLLYEGIVHFSNSLLLRVETPC